MTCIPRLPSLPGRALAVIANARSKGFFHLLSASLFIRFLGFGAQLLVARFLTRTELGQIKAMQSFLDVGTVLAGFGFSTAALKLCSENRPIPERAFIFRQSLLHSTLPTMVVLAGLWVLASLHLLSPDPAVNQLIPTYALTIPALVYATLFIVYLQARRKIQLLAKAQVVIRTAGLTVLVLLTYLFGIRGFVWASVAAGTLAVLPLYAIVRAELATAVPVPNTLAQSLYYAKWSVAGNGVSTLGAYMDIFMLNYFATDRERLGCYGLATIFITGLNYIITTIQSISTPYFSEKSQSRQEFLRVLTKYQKLIILVAFGVSLASAAVVPPFISLVFGQKYAASGVYFRILLVKYFFASCYALLGVALIGIGKMRYNFLSVAISVPVSVLLNIVLIRRHGFVGAALAQALAYLVALVAVTQFSRRAIGAHFDAVEQAAAHP